MTRLAARLAGRIRAGGPMTIAEYMAACLADPVDGYYMTRQPFGPDGDFVTAPEVSQMFGELIGLWAVAAWTAMGAPARFVLAELGPGRGTLMADLVRAARLRPEFLAAASIHLVETSPRLKAAQADALAAAGVPLAWHDRLDDLPAGPLIVVANEFFDALPIRQFVRTAEGWAERMVGIDEEGRLAFGLRTATPPGARQGGRRRAPAPLPGGERSAASVSEAPGEGGMASRDRPQAPSPAPPADGRGSDLSPPGRGEGGPAPAEGAIVEVSPAATAIIETLARRIARSGGAALVIDYGYAGPAVGDTLQAVRTHEYVDVLATPGEADLTAHVDFGALAAAAEAAGAPARPLLTQGDFLRRLGLDQRAARLAGGKDPETRAAIAAAAGRLAGPQAMGELFKVLAISNSGLALPAFDDDSLIRTT